LTDGNTGPNREVTVFCKSPTGRSAPNYPVSNKKKTNKIGLIGKQCYAYPISSCRLGKDYIFSTM